ncbi:MAG: sialidase family protein [Chloroflexota bacterium]
MKHIKIYHEPGRFAGWPANYGIWQWDDEIVLGFTVGYMNPDGGFHARDRSHPFGAMQARSLDGGETWTVVETPCRVPGNRGLSTDEHVVTDLGIEAVANTVNEPTDPPGNIDFAHPDFALMCGRTGLRAGARSWFYVSYDRCHSWDGPYALPMFAQTGIAARTDYIVLSQNHCLFFLTSAKPNGEEGRVFCAQTTDGGKTVEFVSWIGDEPPGKEFDIMPASLRLPSGRILVAIRCQGNRVGRGTGSNHAELTFTTADNWIDLYASDDNGVTWTHVTQPVADTGKGGNPPTLTRLHDGRICLVYGYRDEPFGMHTRISADDGITWGNDIVLRDDGGNHDIGYPRTIQRPDGTILTAYYFHDDVTGSVMGSASGGEANERYMAATLFTPPS